jgi:hypothetical protein
LSGLDTLTKDEILPFLERLHETLSLPVLYVSHDMAEIERLADHLVLMQSGRVLATGPLSQLQSDPLLPLVASRDAAGRIDAMVVAHDPSDGMSTLSVPGGRFLVPSAGALVGERRRLRGRLPAAVYLLSYSSRHVRRAAAGRRERRVCLVRRRVRARLCVLAHGAGHVRLRARGHARRGADARRVRGGVRLLRPERSVGGLR